MKTKRNAKSFSGRMATLAVVLALVGLLPACRLTEDSGFPPLESQASGQTDSSQPSTQPTGTAQTPSLRVALPMDEPTLDAVRLLYLAKQGGISQEAGQTIGQQISLDALKLYDNGMKIDLITVPAATGATREQVNLWLSTNDLPDIIYTDSAAAKIGLENCRNINDLLYDNPLLSAGQVNIAALDSGRRGDSLLAVPYLASMPVVYFNETLLAQLGLVAPSPDWTWNQLLAFESKAQQAIDAAGLSASPTALAIIGSKAQNSQLIKSVFVMGTPADLLQWLPASLSAEAGWAMWDGQSFQFQKPVFASAAEWLKTIVSGGYSTVHLTAAQRLIAQNGNDLILSGRVLMWAGDSADDSTWENAGLTVTARPIPADQTSGVIQRMPLTVRSLIVSKTATDPALAAELAAFIALDTDSLLMQSRYQVYEGFVPMNNDSAVWDAAVASQSKWNWFRVFDSRIQLSYCRGQQLNAGWDTALQNALQAYGNNLLLAKNATDSNALLQLMNQAAQAAVQGD